MPDFVVKREDGSKISLTSRICFAPLWYFKPEAQQVAHSVSYFPHLGHPQLSTSPEVALRYFGELKKINFKIPQSPEELLKGGYHIKFEDFRKKAGHISIVEVIATLSAIRYVEECGSLVHKFLNLIDIDPEIDRWKALYATSFLAQVNGKLSPLGELNQNHALASSYSSISPFKPWEQVEEAFESPDTAWTGEFRGLQKHLGIPHGKVPKINVINTKADFEEFESQCSK